jgi:hypothetical protein
MAGVNDVNILNIKEADILKTADWIDEHLLGVRIPEPGPNTAAAVVYPEIRRLIALIPNRLSFGTELYSQVVAAEASYKEMVRKVHGKGVTAASDDTVAQLACKKDILYRAIQVLQTQYEAASRMITIIDAENRMSGNRAQT